jgi:murein DD-endopeptidase MepM/ murein hydrolase activator NlpD
MSYIARRLAARVYVFGVLLPGVDIQSVSVTRTRAREAPTANIVLSNPNFRYTVTDDDFAAGFENIPDVIKRAVLVQKRGLGYVLSNEVRQALEARFDVARIAARLSLDAVPEKVRYFPITAGQSIFHGGDAVRIALYDAVRGRWRWAFTGRLLQDDESQSADGTASVTLTAGGASTLLQRARTVINPGYVDGNTVLDVLGDASTVTGLQEAFAGTSLPEYVESMVFGRGATGAGTAFRNVIAVPRFGVGGALPYTIEVAGVGAFRRVPERLAILGPAPDALRSALPSHARDGYTLETWDALVDDVVSPDILDAQDRAVWESAERSDEVLVDLIGRAPERYPIDAGRLLMLIPDPEFIGGIDAVLKQSYASWAATSTFSDRFSMLWDVLERVQFVLRENGAGDIIVEPPLHYEEPWGFGTRRALYEVPAIEIASKTRTTDAENVATLIRASIDAIPSQVEDASSYIPAVFEIIWELIGLYGIRELTVPATGLTTSPAGALALARLRGALHNAGLSRVSLDLVPGREYRPNRPYYCALPGAACVATVERVVETMTPEGATVAPEFSAPRFWRGQVDKATGQRIYESIAGGLDRSVPWREIYERARAQVTQTQPPQVPTATQAQARATARAARAAAAVALGQRGTVARVPEVSQSLPELLQSLPAEETSQSPAAPVGLVYGGRRLRVAVNSPFGARNGRPHQGVDLPVDPGTPVVAAADGVVTAAGPRGGYGYAVYVAHADGRETRYAHLSAFVVAVGASVVAGQLLGYSGGRQGGVGAGNSSGPHLHYEVRENGRAVNPIGSALDPNETGVLRDRE